MEVLIFDNQIIKFMYLSPYSRLTYADEGVHIHQYIFLKELFIKGDKDKLQQIFKALEKGISYTDLVELTSEALGKDHSEEFIVRCIQCGIIE